VITATARLTPTQFGLASASVLVAVLPHLWRLPLPLSALILALLIGRWVQRQRGGARIPASLKLPLVMLFPVLVIFHYGNIFGREPGSALACAMLVLKLVETETRRDARAAICFSSFVLMSALLFDSSLGFALLLFAALALFLAAMRELEPRPVDAAARTWGVSVRDGLRSGAFSLIVAVPLALCVFVFFPRLGSPLWGAPTDTSARTGLGDRMAPGAFQELLIDDTPAFRASFDGPLPARANLYWRGPVLWHFDGTAWTRPEYFASTNDAGTLQTTGATIGYDVTLEPSDQRWLLALDMPIDVPNNAVRGADMSLVSHTPVDRLLRYHTTSATKYHLDVTLSRWQRGLALQLPEGFDPRARELAQRWRNDLHSDDAVIAAALELFHNEFFYTLKAPLLGHDSVDDFLFGEHRGFCEHFSSTFTFLMRAASIPARVVTGYQGGYYNATGDYLVVRQSDAHAWAEVWLAGRGWVRVDPTAAVSPQRVEFGARAAAGASAPWYQADWLLGLRNQFDLVNRVWNDAVVQFNTLRQQSLLAPFGIDKADYADLVAVLIGLSTLLLAVFAWWTLRSPSIASDPLDAAYARLCGKLARAGATRAPAEGPQSFAQRIAATQQTNDVIRNPALVQNPAIQDLFTQYVSLRYACALPLAAAVRIFGRRVDALRVAAAPSASK
jgi:protein-glutamine gamma-glutamyltransferase